MEESGRQLPAKSPGGAPTTSAEIVGPHAIEDVTSRFLSQRRRFIAYARRKGSGLEEAEDIFQEALKRWYTNPKPLLNVEGWLFVTFARELRLRLRQRARALAAESDLAHAEAIRLRRLDPSKGVLLGEVGRALATLGERDRKILLMRYFLGLSDSEIANCLPLKVTSIKNALSRALGKLRRATGIRR